jgi:uncharacterized protein (TIRG00374 family)
VSEASTRRVLIGLVVGLPISGGFLWLAIRNAELAEVRSTLGNADLGLVALAVLALGVVYALQAARWREIAAQPHVSWSRFYEMVLSAVACNNVLPARLGDLLRARWLSLDARISTGRALGTVILDRGCDVAALLLLLAIGIGAVATAGWLAPIAVGAATALLGLAAVVVFARVYTARRDRGRRTRGVLRRVLRDTAEGLAEPIARRRAALWFVLSLMAWTTWAVSAALVAESLGLRLGVVDAMFVAAVMNLGVAIPSSPGFVGTYEWLGVASLGLLGIGSEEALAFSILLHACWYVPTTLVGLASLGVRGVVRLRRAAPAARDAVR